MLRRTAQPRWLLRLALLFGVFSTGCTVPGNSSSMLGQLTDTSSASVRKAAAKDPFPSASEAGLAEAQSDTKKR